MTLRLTLHVYARIAVGFVGFFGGSVLFTLLVFTNPGSNLGATAFLFYGLIFGGAFLAQMAFSYLVPASCPACGAASAVPTVRKQFIYVCRACGVKTDAARVMLIEQFASMRRDAVQQEKSESRLVWVVVVIGVGCLGAGIWLAQDAIDLYRHGISTEAKVMRVTQKPTRDSKGRDETSYTAFVQYQVGNVPHTLIRRWSVPAGGRCGSPCYDEGQPLKVIYMPDDPAQAKVHSLAELFFAPALFCVVGTVFASFGALAIRHQRRRGRPRPPP